MEKSHYYIKEELVLKQKKLTKETIKLLLQYNNKYIPLFIKNKKKKLLC